MRIWKERDRSKGICPKCKVIVETVFERRTFPLKVSRRRVKDVLVAVCSVCDEMVSVPPQSTPRLKEARLSERKSLEIRLAYEYKDIVLTVTDTLGAGDPQAALAPLFRMYLLLLADDPTAVKHTLKLLNQPPFSQPMPLSDRISLKLSDLHYSALTSLKRAFKSSSEVIRGIIALSKEDVLDGRDLKRKQLLQSAIQASA